MLTLEILDKNKHDRKSFNCGNSDLDNYIKQTARQDVDHGITQVYVLVEEHRQTVGMLKKIYGYFTLNAFLVLTADIPTPNKKPQIKYQETPAILIGRLAKSLRQNQISGSEILYSALCKAKSISKEIGAAFVVVHAIDDKAAAFYLKNGFEKIPSKENAFIFPLSSVEYEPSSACPQTNQSIRYIKDLELEEV